MEGFFYYNDFSTQGELVKATDELKTDKPKISTEVNGKNKTLIVRLVDWLAKIHHWFSLPIEAEAQEVYDEGRMPLYWKG
jgi:hypothetical protein